ncbi:potassium channel subfamily K member 10-like isoform X2 [Convolutriloba macropyga]|uniref:potassium channel subfamily K member 10-like isoform X2 n=1 Tax=Convolutriloba macropyga TaxID=536237 RepID=UPI003F521919
MTAEEVNKCEATTPEWTRKSTFTMVNSILGVTAYLMLGALVFSALELPEEEDRLRQQKKEAEQMAEVLVETLINNTLLRACNESYSECEAFIDWGDAYNESYAMIDELLASLGYNQFKVDPSSDEIVTSWDLAGAVYFCITTVTTIGYGNIAPSHDGTRLLTIFYTILGIPAFLYACSQLSSLFSYMFYRCRRRMGIHYKPDKTDSTNSKMNRACYYVICSIIIFGVLFILPVPLLVYRADLTAISAVYFIVISVTTVGYGDIYPVDPAKEEGANGFRFGFCFAIWFYMLFGIALFGNFLDLLQNIIEKWTISCQNKIETEMNDVIESVQNQTASPDTPNALDALAIKSQTVFALREDFGLGIGSGIEAGKLDETRGGIKSPLGGSDSSEHIYPLVAPKKT